MRVAISHSGSPRRSMPLHPCPSPTMLCGNRSPPLRSSHAGCGEDHGPTRLPAFLLLSPLLSGATVSAPPPLSTIVSAACAPPFSPPRSTPPSLLHGWRGGALPLSALGAAQRRYVAGHRGLESSAGGTTSRGAGVPACAAAEQPPSTSERAAVRKAGQRRPELLRCGLQAALCMCRVGLLRARPTLNGTTCPYLGRATARGRA
jgi:hypothetical protein